MKIMNKFLIPLMMVLALSSCKFFYSDEETGREPAAVVAVEAEGDYETRNLEAGEFDSIVLEFPCEVEYVSGRPSVMASGRSGILDHMMVTVEGGVLRVESDDTRLKNTGDVTLALSSSTLRSIGISGVARFTAGEGFRTDDLHVAISGTGDVRIDNLKADNVCVDGSGAVNMEMDGLDCKSLKVDISGAGNAIFSGTAASAEAEIGGVGKVDFKRLSVENYSSSVSGVGSVREPKFIGQ